uniref:Large ribosomal subunit protein uL22c n=1 Tax=Crepidomanes minutum TaxID=32127 RepID=A0A8K1VNL6_9MONI|nr:ribosomal protein L22 [Crepidomanes minutum]UEQ13227.1 ribosomal protein L22 [Crepidomanes minutum]
METQASSKNIKMSATKVRRIINQIQGCSYEKALVLLEFLPHRACYPILQLIVSAAANAAHNLRLSKSKLFITGAQVNKSTYLKRFRPRAQGRGYPIRKPTCNITIRLKEID